MSGVCIFSIEHVAENFVEHFYGISSGKNRWLLDGSSFPSRWLLTRVDVD